MATVQHTKQMSHRGRETGGLQATEGGPPSSLRQEGLSGPGESGHLGDPALIWAAQVSIPSRTIQRFQCRSPCWLVVWP